ncbi:glutamate-5-semialdehyde dehydrogenase [Thalassospira sp. MCCC 1A01428]|uniref:glutamate-5-semialdehyde dehydrogenase n=1 Tax=Thalassospira sp. MCCC 1A01428 TaxID=1470575 RepID=UPI000A1EEDA6|nr:glutamate-5-semialdehyde dehydrogenase [Thalassospira sp. MCCC 1A01428]OSQ45098.1 gamma-glutamyl phosphate reductase [Thalassospira sp. MCCC 1A01428]
MTALASTENQDISHLMLRIGIAARDAALILAQVPSQPKIDALNHAARLIRENADKILAANAVDMEGGRKKGLTAALLDRLELTPARVEAMAKGVEDVARQNDPVGREMARWTPEHNGLDIARVCVPLGVIGIIYESRPNVTADAAAMCLKSGNAAILRGGSESFNSSRAIFDCMKQGVIEAGLPDACIQMIPVTDRAAVGEMLKLSDYIDVIVPRGGKSLIQRITDESRIPLFKHLEGLCHTYIHASANPAKINDIVLNAKMRRVGVCGSTETVLIDRAVIGTLLPALADALAKAGCEMRGDDTACGLDARIKPATEADWSTEYLDAIVSIKTVDGVKDAIHHINHYGSHHTDAILAEDSAATEAFLNGVDSGIVIVNASTQFADGGEFGMGAEIGISTGKLHARGPVGVEQLTSYKYVVRGTGQTRP